MDAQALQSWGMIILLVIIFYFFMIRPQQKRQKETQKFRDGLQKGDKVITAGGIHGKISSIEKNTIVVEIATGVKITIEKSMIYPSANDAQADAANTVNADNK
jgi:preprotein translocase subunit YajC